VVQNVQQGVQAKLCATDATQLVDGHQDLPSHGVALVADPPGDGERRNGQ